MSDQQKKPDLGLLEEDDEFEEFPAEGNSDVNNLQTVDFLNTGNKSTGYWS